MSGLVRCHVGEPSECATAKTTRFSPTTIDMEIKEGPLGNIDILQRCAGYVLFSDCKYNLDYPEFKNLQGNIHFWIAGVKGVSIYL